MKKKEKFLSFRRAYTMISKFYFIYWIQDESLIEIPYSKII